MRIYRRPEEFLLPQLLNQNLLFHFFLLLFEKPFCREAVNSKMDQEPFGIRDFCKTEQPPESRFSIPDFTKGFSLVFTPKGRTH